MCCIYAWCGRDYDEKSFCEAMKKTVSRGPDRSRLFVSDEGIMGFQRLSIMGLTPEGMQPFLHEESVLVCNGEIYGFQKLRDELIEKGYSFKSDSDCEILLPLYYEYGKDMFSQRNG